MCFWRETGTWRKNRSTSVSLDPDRRNADSTPWHYIHTHTTQHNTHKQSFTRWNEVINYIPLVSRAHTQSGRRCSWSFCCWDMWGSFWRWTTAEEWVWCPATLWSRDPRSNWHLPTDPRPELRTHWSAARDTVSLQSLSSKGSWDTCVCVCLRTMNE